MRILHIGKYYPPVPGGIERHVRDMCEGLRERGIRASCLAFSSSQQGTTMQHGVPVTLVSKLVKDAPPFNPFFVSTLARMQQEADIVHLHMPNPCAEVSCLLTRPKKLVVTYHADIVGKRGAALYLPFQRMLLRRADAILVSSKQYRDSSPVLQEFKDKCTVIPLGIDAARFQKAGRSRIAAVKHAAGPRFLFVGRLVPYKGLRFLLDAMRNVKGTLLIVGEGPLKEQLQSRARRLGITGRVEWLGKVNELELAALYRASDIAVLPSVSRAEAFGYAQLEAMASGKPVISTRLGTGTDAVNLHGKTGLVVPPGNARALSDAMTALGRDAALRRRMGAAGRARAAREFTRARMVEHVLDVYREVLAR